MKHFSEALQRGTKVPRYDFDRPAGRRFTGLRMTFAYGGSVMHALVFASLFFSSRPRGRPFPSEGVYTDPVRVSLASKRTIGYSGYGFGDSFGDRIAPIAIAQSNRQRRCRRDRSHNDGADSLHLCGGILCFLVPVGGTEK